MKIIFRKLNSVSHELKVIRADNSYEIAVLETDTYQLHDICHFFVERELKTMEGFWGMLSQGYKMEQLSGKTNTLTQKTKVNRMYCGGNAIRLLRSHGQVRFQGIHGNCGVGFIG